MGTHVTVNAHVIKKAYPFDQHLRMGVIGKETGRVTKPGKLALSVIITLKSKRARNKRRTLLVIILWIKDERKRKIKRENDAVDRDASYHMPEVKINNYDLICN